MCPYAKSKYRGSACVSTDTDYACTLSDDFGSLVLFEVCILQTVKEHPKCILRKTNVGNKKSKQIINFPEDLGSKVIDTPDCAVL